MRTSLFATTLAACGLAAVLEAQQPPTKVGIIHIQQAIISTKDGQKAAAELQERFDPKRKELEKKQSEIQALQEQLRRGANTLSEEARQKLMREIDNKTRALNRETEDAQAEFDQEQQKILQELGGRLMQVIDKYARDNGFALILDVSSPQTPVLYAANSIDITQAIVELYDKNSPSAAAPATPSAKPATPAPKPAAAPKPAGVK
ncbi:MAG: OmpH family outer membrane protein [Bryobacterales bacterium]|nr:OmpH family outer membrane protein [Bryobacteraceae bacterium]MDW8129368.1 OmpH family outer membrane protein [Bryobacterales bacterium]